MREAAAEYPGGAVVYGVQLGCEPESDRGEGIES